MNINFENVGIRYKSLIRKIYNYCAVYTENNLENTSITVTFEGEQRIRELNKQYRNVDRATDVLSFPMLNIAYPQKLKDYTDETSPDGELYLGDVVICPKIARRQAREYGHSKKREIGFLALHGLLHVLGYDHMTEDEEKIMMGTANEILKNLNLKRKKDV